MRQKLIELQGEKDESTTIVGNFNNSLLEMDRCSRQKISKHIVELNDTINQLDVMEIYRLFYAILGGYTIFSGSHVTFANRPHSGPQIHFNNFKRIENICLPSDHHGIKLEINNRETTGKF